MSSMDIIQKKKEGEVFKTSSGLMAVKTADDYIVIKEIQPEGKNVMTGGNFLNGYPNVVGSILS